MNTNTASQILNPKISRWIDICSAEDLIAFSGIPAFVSGQQAAVFYVPDAIPQVYALDNWCPSAEANVLSRGIVGDLGGELVVASPIYKDHYSLGSGACLEKPLSVRVWPVCVQGDRVLLQLPSSTA
jgi:nitrite reductase (NADH) small subunit